MSLSDPYAALRLRDFRCYLASSMLGILGFQVQILAVRYEIFGRTDDYMSLGWMGLLMTLPAFLLTLPAGQLADWFDRRIVIALALLTAAFGSMGLFLISIYHGPLWMVYACVLLRSTAGTFTQPARGALLPQIVPRDDFANAITWNSSIMQTALMVGPALGGFIAWWSIPAAYLTDAGCMLLSILCIAAINHRLPAKPREPATVKAVMAGLRYVFSTKVILATLTLDLMATIFGGATALLPGFSKNILHVGPQGLGWLNSAPAAGAVVMSGVLAHFGPLKNAGRALIIAVIGFGAATALFGVSTSFPLSLFLLFMTGAFDNISVVVRHTLVMALAPEEMRGRIAAVNSLFIGASNRLSDFESGVTARFWGPVASVVFGGVGSIVSVLAASIKWPELRHIGALDALRPAANPSDTESAKESEAPAVVQ
jgi:MFS family permease